MPKGNVSVSVIKRLPRYYRFLGELLKNGVTRTSSKELAFTMKLTASQIRQDLNCFGGFGQQGYGYNVEALYKEIGNILGVYEAADIILIGAGNLGTAIATHMDFESRGFRLTAIFDSKEELMGKSLQGVKVRNSSELEKYCLEHRPAAAILCIPRENAKDIVEMLISLGIKGFWNFSHYDISIDYSDVAVENVHLGDSMMTLSYHIKEQLEK